MPFEALESFTTSLFGVAAVSYAAKVSCSSTVATLQGLFLGLMHGVGKNKRVHITHLHIHGEK